MTDGSTPDKSLFNWINLCLIKCVYDMWVPLVSALFWINLWIMFFFIKENPKIVYDDLKL